MRGLLCVCAVMGTCCKCVREQEVGISFLCLYVIVCVYGVGLLDVGVGQLSCVFVGGLLRESACRWA